MTLAILWLQLGVAAAVILGASLFLAKSADVIAIKTGLGRSFVGVVLLATATSLPELGTGVSAVAIVGEPDLAVGGAFGSKPVQPADNRPDGHLLVEPLPPEPRGHVLGRRRGAGHRSPSRLAASPSSSTA